MMHKLIKLLLIATSCISSACTQYKPKALTELAVQQQLETPTPEQLSIQAAQIKHPLLKPIAFNIQDGLSPDEAGVLAVLRNPGLRAARDRHGIANAQLLQAGLLPNPILSYNFAALSGGLDQGKVTGYGVGLAWEATSIITQANKITAAAAEQQAVDLQIAWQEWQIALAAKMAVYKLVAYTKQQQLLKEMLQRLESNRARIQEAADKKLVTELDRVAAVSAKNVIDVRLQALMQQKNQQQQQRLNRALGLKPDEAIKLQQNIALTYEWVAPAYDKLTHDLTNRRLDLMALQQAYKNQDEQVRIAVLQQFPSISIGFTQTKNNSDYYTVGAGVAVTLPIFDQNQGKIALAEATRQQLFDEYTNRVFQSNADISELLVTITALNKQIQSINHAIPDLENLVSAYKLAVKDRQVNVLNYYTAWNNWTDKKIELLSLQLQLVEARIALEIATGIYQI
ncbi:TolC family protein [Methyloglobulus sp.]|uniref:TolC family protein n=1 Tax=Methyloglobulus sp. TaxID=2518622 RepID=UPI0032B806E4